MSDRSLTVKEAREFVTRSGKFGEAAQVMGDMALRVINAEHSGLYLAMVLTVQMFQEQHICCRLNEYAGTRLCVPEKGLSLQLPEWELWRSSLQQQECAPAVAVLDDRSDTVPECLLVVDRYGGCYLQRQWSFERSITRVLLERAGSKVDLPELEKGFLHSLVEFFPDKAHHSNTDYQQFAVMAALRSKLLVLSGGPGTGKTTVAAGILAMKLSVNPDLRIISAAPTAKAATRLVESLQENLKHLRVNKEVKAQIAQLTAGTLQRVLGFKRDSHEFAHDQTNPLDCDLLLVDECSMVPQHLMARLLEALPANADLILLGDKYQLASVEAGSVFGDICDSARSNLADEALASAFFRQTGWQVEKVLTAEQLAHPLSGSLVELVENHRFDVGAPILGSIAGLIRNLKNDDDFELIAREIAVLEGDEFEFTAASETQLRRLLRQKISTPRLRSGESLADLSRLAGSGSAEDRRKAFALLDTFKVLAPTYRGAQGLDKLNEMFMELLELPDKYAAGVPLLILHNDYRRELFNGDIGLVARDENGALRVFFEGREKSFAISDLPEHEVVFAMSVHKSQGSGFDEVLFVMPPQSNELMTREMVYTAMTRARKKLCCCGTVNVLASALQKRTCRMSNLTHRLTREA